MPLPAPSAPREAIVHRLADRLQQRHHPRLALSAILGGAGGVGFLTSFALLRLGVASMPVRYALAAAAGYLAFLALVRLWAGWYAERQDAAADLTDVLAETAIDTASLSYDAVPSTFGGGGGMAGGGAGRGFDTDAGVATVDVADGAASLADTDEGALIVVPILIGAVVVAGLAGTVTVLVGAPALLAEVILDAFVATAVYRRLRRLEPQHWTTGILRRTWKPMLAITIVLIAAAAVAQRLVPAAQSIGDLWR